MNDSQRNITKSTWPVSIPVAISSRHVHLTQAMIERLFGDKYRLHVDSALHQPHQYLAMETVTLVGPYGRIRNVCVVGPARSVNQVEISRTDAITLGTKAPVRESGDLIGSPGIVIEGPRAEVQLGTGLICAFRHIHMSPAEAERLGVKDRDRVEVSTEVYNRRMLFRDVLVRVSRTIN